DLSTVGGVVVAECQIVARERVELVVPAALGDPRARVAVADLDVGARARADLVVATAGRRPGHGVAVADLEIAAGGGLEVVVGGALGIAASDRRAVADQRVVAVLGTDEVLRPAGRIQLGVVVADD